MPCDECKNLQSLHEWAVHRVKLYRNPRSEPILSRTDGPALREKLGKARTEELELRAQLEAHIEFCQVCREELRR